MSGQITPRPNPIKPGDSLEAKHVDLLFTSVSRLGAAPEFREAGFACDGLLCVCSGDDDCNDMFTGGVCGDAMCFTDSEGGVVCICVAV
jgi:hypothetical protein